MKTQTTYLELPTPHGISIQSLMPELHSLLTRSGIRTGLMTITSQHTTTAITINENEPRLIEDIKRFLTRLIPPGDRYLHNDIALRDCPEDEPENAHAHLAAMLLGSSESIPIADGALMLGQYQSVLFCDLDGPRTRRIAIHLQGE